MTFDLSTEQARDAFRSKIIESDPTAIGFVATLATQLGIHRAYDPISPGLFVQRNDADKEPGTIVGICGGRRFLVDDACIVGLVEDWHRLIGTRMSDVRLANRALAVLILLADTRPNIEGHSVPYAEEMIEVSPDLIVQFLKLREEKDRVQSCLDACYETIHAARKLLGLSLRESQYIPNAIRELKRELAEAKTER